MMMMMMMWISSSAFIQLLPRSVGSVQNYVQFSDNFPCSWFLWRAMLCAVLLLMLCNTTFDTLSHECAERKELIKSLEGFIRGKMFCSFSRSRSLLHLPLHSRSDEKFISFGILHNSHTISAKKSSSALEIYLRIVRCLVAFSEFVFLFSLVVVSSSSCYQFSKLISSLIYEKYVSQFTVLLALRSGVKITTSEREISSREECDKIKKKSYLKDDKFDTFSAHHR